MFGIAEHYEKWMEEPLFHCSSDDLRVHLQFVHMKCFAVTLMNSCVMNILVVNAIQMYLMGLLGISALIILLSPLLVEKVIPIILLVFAFYIPYFGGYVNFRYGTFYIYCLICCMEVQGFEFLFDLYLIVCYVIESGYSFYMKRHFNVLSTTICEFGIWTIPCSMWFRLGTTFAYLAIEAWNYPQIWAISTFFVSMSFYLFLSHAFGMDLGEQIEEFRHAAEYLIEFFITNASMVVVPEKRRFYKSP